MEKRDERASTDEPRNRPEAAPPVDEAAADDEATVARLLAAAGPRPPLEDDDVAEIRDAVHAAWREQVGAAEPASPSAAGGGRSRLAWAASLAAAVAAAVLAGWWLLGGAGGVGGSGDAAAAPRVAVLQAADGQVELSGEADEVRPTVVGEELRLGDEVRVASGGHAALHLDGGADVRLDAGTRLRLLSAAKVELTRGAVYVDTRPPEAPELAGRLPVLGATVIVHTPAGVVHDVGTRFAVRIQPQAGGGGAAVAVLVRDGEIVVEEAVPEGDPKPRAGAGEGLVLRPGEAVERHRVEPFGDAWAWVLAAAPPWRLEGRSLADLLAWVSRETGWRVRYADHSLAETAPGVVLHGDLGGLRPDQAPFAVLPGAGLQAELADGVLVVRRADP
jgi:hypothetical protein